MGTRSRKDALDSYAVGFKLLRDIMMANTETVQLSLFSFFKKNQINSTMALVITKQGWIQKVKGQRNIWIVKKAHKFQELAINPEMAFALIKQHKVLIRWESSNSEIVSAQRKNKAEATMQRKSLSTGKEKVTVNLPRVTRTELREALLPGSTEDLNELNQLQVEAREKQTGLALTRIASILADKASKLAATKMSELQSMWSSIMPDHSCTTTFGKPGESFEEDIRLLFNSSGRKGYSFVYNLIYPKCLSQITNAFLEQVEQKGDLDETS